jgi:hypothetical protein
MVPAGQNVNPQSEQLLRQPRGDPEARSGVFTVRDDQIDLPMRYDVRQPVAHDLPPRRPNNISNKQYAHTLASLMGAGGEVWSNRRDQSPATNRQSLSPLGLL